VTRPRSPPAVRAGPRGTRTTPTRAVGGIAVGVATAHATPHRRGPVGPAQRFRGISPFSRSGPPPLGRVGSGTVRRDDPSERREDATGVAFPHGGLNIDPAAAGVECRPADTTQDREPTRPGPGRASEPAGRTVTSTQPPDASMGQMEARSASRWGGRPRLHPRTRQGNPAPWGSGAASHRCAAGRTSWICTSLVELLS